MLGHFKNIANVYFIVLGDNAGKDANGDFNINEYEKDVRHEYGHTKQYDNMGPVKFIKDVAIPSMRGYTKSSKGEKMWVEVKNTRA